MLKRINIASISFIAFVLASGTALHAQELSNGDRYRMNEKLINLICDYELYSVFPGESDYEFLSLFSRDAQVYCDYFSSNDFQKMMSPQEYAAYSLENTASLRTRIKNVKKQEYTRKNGKTTVTVTFDKEVSYVDDGKVFFSVKNQTLEGDMSMTMECSYSDEEGRFYIDQIKGEYRGDTFGDRFLIVKKNSRDDEESLLIDGQRPDFSEEREMVLVRSTSRFTTDDDDLVLLKNIKKTSSRYDVATFSYKPMQFRVKARAGFAPVMAYSINSNVDFEKTKSSAYEAGVDFAYLHRVNSRNKIGVGTGLSVSLSSLSMQAAHVSYTLPSYDESFVPYNRRYTLNDVSEGIRFTDAVLPLYLAYECRLAKRVTYTLDAGMKLYLNLNTKVVPYQIDGFVEKDYGGGKVPERTDISGTYQEYLVPVSYKRNTYDVSAFARTGVDISLVKKLSLSLQAGYEYGITRSYNSNGSNWFSEETGDYPLIYSSKSHSDQAVRSFADCISYRRNAIWFEVGLKYKF